MTYKELKNALSQGKALTHCSSDGTCVYYIQRDGRDFVARGKETDVYLGPYNLHITAEEILKDNIPYGIYEKPILTESEKRYLSVVVKPYIERYNVTIIKRKYLDKRFISICYCNEKGSSVQSSTDFPLFGADEMYVGMEENKHYTSDDLELDY